MYFCEDNLFVKVKLTNKALGVNIADNQEINFSGRKYLYLYLLGLFVHKIGDFIY